MSKSARRSLVMVLVIALLGLPIGYAYGYATVQMAGGDWTLTMQILSAATGLTMAGLVSALNLFVFHGVAEPLIKRLPLALSFVLRTLSLTAVILVVLILNRTAIQTATGLGFWQIGGPGSILRGVIFAFAISALFMFVLDMRALVGPRAFSNFVRGRYHRPVSEERVFAFVDIVGSTAAAQKLGDKLFHDYVSDFFYELDETIIDHNGEIEAYVGDAIIISWPMRQGSRSADPLACAFAIMDVANAVGDRFEKRFGERPKVRVSLHGGPVVTGECGRSRRQITFMGDTVNMTARLESVLKETGADIVVSGQLLERSQLPAGAKADLLGEFALKGIKDEAPVYSLHRHG